MPPTPVPPPQPPPSLAADPSALSPALASASAPAAVGVANAAAKDKDVGSLLDTIDSFGGPPPSQAPQQQQQQQRRRRQAESKQDGGGADHAQTAATPTPSQPTFDPISFLNHHYATESALVSALPTLRSTISERITTLDESISSTIQKQSDLATLTATDVARARQAILRLQSRIGTVQSKARLSERAVLEITRDMKRLDYAKRHLSRTITALKRLHMLLHAVDRLHAAAHETPYPDYGTCANLIDATRLLLGHFDGYMGSIQKMRDVRDSVGTVRLELREGAVFGFRVVGLGFKKALEMSGGTVPGTTGRPTKRDGDDGDDAGSSPPPPMPPNVLTEACLMIDALGLPTRKEFVGTFCNDHLKPYAELFDPKAGSDGKAAGEQQQPKASFKIAIPSTSSHGGSSAAGTGGEGGGGGTGALSPSSQVLMGAGSGTDGTNPNPNPNPSSLDQIDRRYAWYRRTLRELHDTDKFRDVFPPRWNVYHEMTFRFLAHTADHLKSLLTPLRPYRDRDCDNVTVLLKALQRTIMFEKEMTAWLQRECGTVFLDGSKEAEEAARRAEAEAEELELGEGQGATHQRQPVVGDDGEELEFDESGTAVPAGSAEGIRIKYERKMKERRAGRERTGDGIVGTSEVAGDPSTPGGARGGGANRPVPVRPLVGVASSSFDGYMGPYIELEEQNMDEQLVESTTDKAVDTRGELPVFTSSTALFVYIKNSITRCTGLTRGQTFYQLYGAFQDTLRKYATVLGGMYPKPGFAGDVVKASATAAINFAGVSAASAAGIAGVGGSGSGGSGPSYRIPPGEEVTVCHVIDTCEYCADTVEALEDLIRDKIEDKFKDRIDMSGEQEAFHDVTARGIRVLVSGLENRTDRPMREMSGMKWGDLDAVGEESPYVRAMHDAIQPFVVTVRGLLPTSYFRSFCDKFAAAFTSSFYNALVRQKRISEAGTQQLLLDVYNLKTLLLKLPVLEKTGAKKGGIGGGKGHGHAPAGSTIPPAMYTKMVTKQFQRIEILLKLVGTPNELLIDMFKSQWEGGSALDFQTVMNLKGMKRNEQASMLEKLGIDPILAMKAGAHGAAGSNITEHVQALQDKGSDVAAKVNSDLSQMRRKVDNFRSAFR